MLLDVATASESESEQQQLLVGGALGLQRQTDAEQSDEYQYRICVDWTPPIVFKGHGDAEDNEDPHPEGTVQRGKMIQEVFHGESTEENSHNLTL